MKNAKLTKTFILLFIAVMFFVASFSVMGLTGAKATNSELDFLGGSAIQNATLNQANSTIDVNVTTNDTLSFKNKLCIEDFEMKFSLDENVTNAKLTLSSKGQFVTDEDAENVINIDNTTLTDYVLKLSVVDNVINYDLNGQKSTLDDKVSMAGKTVASFEFSFTVNDSETGKIALFYVDQNVKEEVYKVDFANDGSKLANKNLNPIIVPKADFVETGKAIDGQIYTLDFETYCLFDTSSSECYVEAGDCVDNNIWVEKATSGYAQKIQFNKKEADEKITMNYNVCYKSVQQTLEVEVINVDADTTAPVYVGGEDAIKSYKKAVEKASYSDYENKINIALGESFEIPSLKDLVKDDVTSYDNLTTVVYYRTPETSGTSSSLKFATDAAGKYEFFVVFKDVAGNIIDSDDFYTIDEENESVITEGKLYSYVFSFTIQDNHPLSVEAPASQGEGFVGTVYTASAFTVKGDSTTEYKLFYNVNVNAEADDEGWVEIIKLATNDTAESLGITTEIYNMYKAIDYNGKLGFTPIEKGAYKITCTAYSKTKVRSDSASSIIKVEKEPTVVKPANHWLEENVWSVVFLSIGTVCLIAIVVLIFIKPKDKKED